MLLAIVLPLLSTGEYFVFYFVATSECCNIFFWLWLLVNAEGCLLAIVLPFLNAGEYFVGYCHALNECLTKLSIIMPLVKVGEFFVGY